MRIKSPVKADGGEREGNDGACLYLLSLPLPDEATTAGPIPCNQISSLTMQNLITNKKKSSSGRKTKLRVEKKKTGSNVEEKRRCNKKTRPKVLTTVKVRREMLRL